jgi:hypothetical protein
MKLITARDVYHLEKKIEEGQMSKYDILVLLEYAKEATEKIINTQNRLEKAKRIIEQQIKELL